MNGKDFGDLAVLWGSVPDEADVVMVDELARLTPRVARREMIGEAAVAGGIFVAIALAVLFRPGLDTLATGGLLLTVLGWSAWQRYRLGVAAGRMGRTDCASYLATTVAAKRAEVRRSAIGVALILPSAFLGILLLFAIRGGGEGVDLARFILSLPATGKGAASLIVLVVAVVVFAAEHVRVRRELHRLLALSAAYAEEERQERLADG